MVRKILVTSLIFCALLAIWSCDHGLQQALDMSGNNKSKLEKVLEHVINHLYSSKNHLCLPMQTFSCREAYSNLKNGNSICHIYSKAK